MVKKKNFIIMAIVLLFILAATPFSSCSSGGSTAGPPGDSKVTGEAKSVLKNVSDYPYEVNFLVLSSENVTSLPNPTKDDVGLIITAETNEDVYGLDPGEKFTANVKWAIDSTKAVPILYVYNVKEIH